MLTYQPSSKGGVFMGKRKNTAKQSKDITMLTGSKPPSISPTEQKKVVGKAGAYAGAVVIAWHLLENSLITKAEYRKVEKHFAKHYGISTNSIFRIGDEI